MLWLRLQCQLVKTRQTSDEEEEKESRDKIPEVDMTGS